MKAAYILFLFIVFTSCRDSAYKKAADEIASKLPEPTNMNVGHDKYALYIPNGWTTESRTMYGIDYYSLFAPKTTEDPNTSVNVITEYMRRLSLEEYRRKTIESVKKAVPSAINFKMGTITANELKGCWYSYDMKPQDIEASLVCYIFPKNGAAYILTAGTQTKLAVRYRSTFDSVAASLKFAQ